MIYDCVLFNGERDMLELRLHTLADVVDRFIIVEAGETFTGQPKAFSAIGDMLDGFPVHLWIPGRSPSGASAWQRESWQRNSIGNALKALDAKPNDVILVSDVDEIPRADAVAEAWKWLANPAYRAPLAFRQTVYFYHPQCLNNLLWYGTRAVRYGDMASPQALRATEYLRPDEAAFSDGGWHFSYFMSPAEIQRKLAAYSHTEVNQAPYNTLENIEAAMRECRSLVPTDGQTFTCLSQPSADLPAFMLSNLDRWMRTAVPA